VTIPDYQTCMLPVLRGLEDGELHVHQEVLATVTDFFNLSEAERKEMLPSGKAPVIRSRISWAITCLKQAGLLHSPKRGVYRPTDLRTTMIYTHVLNRGGLAVHSPADALGQGMTPTLGLAVQMGALILGSGILLDLALRRELDGD